MDIERFNRSGPREQAKAIVEAGAKARGQAAPLLDQPIEVEDNDPELLAAAICRAGEKARGQK